MTLQASPCDKPILLRLCAVPVVHRTLRRVTGSALAVAGGALVTFGGVANHSFLLSILGLVDENLGGFLSGVPL